MKRKVTLLKKFVLAAGIVILGGAPGHAQSTPTLSLAAGKVGITGGQNGTANNFEFYMEPAGYARAVSAGETVFMMGSWPSGSTPTMSDDKSNAWAAVTSCSDSQSLAHGFFYAVNAAAGTSVITETHGSQIKNTVFDWAHFYNMSTTGSGFVDGSSCKTGITPSSNTAPNITGTAFTTTTSGDLILTCVYVEQGTLNEPNAFTSVTWPSGFTGLSEETSYGHACAYGVQATAGSFTPTFTIAQGTHNTFTIMSAAFKAGTGGTAPSAGAAITLSEMHYAAGKGQSETVYLPCPANTSAVLVADDAASLTGVSDSNSNAWSSAPNIGNNYGGIFYANQPTISSTNAYQVTMTFRSSGNYDLLGLYCLTGTAGIDTAVTAQNGSSLNVAGSVFGTGNVSGGVANNAPSLATSSAGDLVFDVGAMGFGPVDSCITNHCVFDYVGSTSWSGGDNESYANGDLLAHAYVPTAGTVSFNFNIGSGTSSTASGMSLAFKSGSGGGGPTPPAPPTGLKATVQ